MTLFRITRPYGGTTLQLRIGAKCIGTVTQSDIDYGRWLCDVRREFEAFYQTLQPHMGTCLSALRYVRRSFKGDYQCLTPTEPSFAPLRRSTNSPALAVALSTPD